MVSRFKIFSFIGGALLTGFIGFRTHLYFTHKAPPEFDLVGISPEGAYKSQLTCYIKADNAYKISELDIKLDGKPFDIKRSHKIGMSKFEIPFLFDTKTLPDGKHTLTIQAVDGSYNANKKVKEWKFEIDNKPLKAALLQQEYKVDQGRTIHARVNLNKAVEKATVTFLGKRYDFFPEAEHSTIYECFVPTDCEQEPSDNPLQVSIEDRVGNTIKLSATATVNAFPFKKATLIGKANAVDKEKLKEEEELSLSDKILESALEKWAKNSPKQKLWNGNFEVPMNVQRIPTPFGEIRATAEKGRYLHKAVDLANLPRSVVWAAQNGKVIIKDRYHMCGNTVVIDHGHGVHTVYCHLDEFAPGLEVGDTLKKGNPIGRVGKTGYASGYHLHWELRVTNVPVDPLQWTERNF